MRKVLAFSLAVLGVSALVAQVLLIRELLVVFTGNEFFIGWTLFAWLFWTALGALLCGRLCAASWNAGRAVVLCHVGVALLIPATIALIRSSPTLLDAVPGAGEVGGHVHEGRFRGAEPVDQHHVGSRADAGNRDAAPGCACVPQLQVRLSAIR